MILKNMSVFSKAIIILVFLLSGRMFAIDKPVRIQAMPALENNPPSTFINVGANHFVQLSAPGASYDKMVTGMVKLMVKTNSQYYVSPYDAEIDLQIQTYDAVGNLLSNSIKTLKVKHQPFANTSYKDQDYVIFNQSPTVYKIITTVSQIKINSVVVSTFPDNLSVESSIDYLRYDPFIITAPSNLQVTPIDIDEALNTDDVLKISWGSVQGAAYYELEYMSVNDYDYVPPTSSTPPNFDVTAAKAATALNYDFKNNSTRIITASTTYSVPNIFDKGYFLCRVRAYGKDISGANPSLLPYYGNWTNNNDAGDVQSFINTSIGYYNTTHFQKDINWQYNATFAEEAKHKDVINYADGSLRSRQTITKMNSNNTTLVGENVYDYTGRAAVSILPTPLKPFPLTQTTGDGSWSFFYKPNQNLSDVSGNKYSKEDFDLDPTSNDPCQPTAYGMKTTTGASQYYSANNPDKAEHQGYIPDANKFPFTQTEFTPDNTGRIKKQGGVGPDHQLGSTHETKYFYGGPEQIELDRLFGSEVGDASHYQKNMVLDANGQVSITYMDMEGKTIATCLAGDPPPNMKTMSKQPATAVQLVSDMFNKDSDSNSENNMVGPDGESIEFNKSILITDAGAINTFDYKLSIANFQDACLMPNVCFNCVYNFDLTITDDCDQQIFPNPANTGPQMIGRFNVVNNQTVFTTACYNPLTLNFQEITNPAIVFPKAGVYYVSKKLSINKDARDFYLKKYLDKNFNSCILDLNDIKNNMPQLDTNDCYASCAKCFQSIGTKDDYVSKGKGTEEEWQAAYDECRSQCGYPKSSCEIALAQLLFDVSPNGQYGNTGDPNDPLSVFNKLNLLPKNIATIPAGPNPPLNISNNINNGPVVPLGVAVAFWKKPLHYKNGQQHYYDKKGKIFKVMLTKVPNSPNQGQFSIPVSSVFQVFTTNTVGVYYTHAQNLLNLSDFLNVWQPSFAKSLVTYHPEFCYYQDCEEKFAKKNFGDTISSNDFDMKLLYTTDFQTAITRNLLIPNSNNGWKLNLAMDPANTSGYYQLPSSTTPMVDKYTTFQPLSSGSLNMDEFSSYTHKCGTQFASNQTNNLACTNFGFPITGSSAQILAMQNLEWNTLRAIYYGEKQKLLYQYSNNKRLTSPSGCNYYNACIGVPGFDGYSTPMVKYQPPSTIPLQTSPYFNCMQPCNQTIKDLYALKTKRFGYSVDAESQVPDESEIAYQQFLQTGRCPMAQDLQDLSNVLAMNNKFAGISEALQNYPAMTINFYNYLNNVAPASPPYTAYLWKATGIANNGLNVNFTKAINNTVVKFVQFNQPSNQFNVVWSNVQSITQFMHTGFNGPNSTFSCIAKEVVGNTTILKALTGLTDIVISGCTFKNQCKPNDLAKQVQTIFNNLKASNTSESTSPITLGAPSSNTPLGPYLSKVQQLIGQNTTTPDFKWKKVTASLASYEIYDASTPNCVLRLNLTTLDGSPLSNPATLAIFNNIKVFTKIKSDYQNFFVMEGRDINNAFLGIVKGEAFKICGGPAVPVTMGSCELPDPASCKTPFHNNRKELEALLKDILEGQKYLPIASAINANVATNINLTSNLLTNFQPLATVIPANKHQIINNFYHVFSQELTPTSGGVNNDSLEFFLKSPCNNIAPPPDDDDNQNSAFSTIEPPCNETEYCKIWLKTNNKNSSSNLSLGNLVKVHKLMGYGPINNNNLTDFIIVADFNVNSTIVKDTLFGSSCYELQNCIPCKEGPNNCCTETFTAVSQDEIFINPSGDPFINDSLALADSTAYSDTSLVAFNSYKTQIQTLNTSMGWTSSDPNYVNVISLKQLKANGYFQVKNNYTNFIQNFDSTLDDHVYLCNISKFVKEHGSVRRPQRCYQRFLKAHQNYNSAALAQSAPTITPMADTTFYTSNLLDSVNVYINYLNNAVVSNTVPLQPDSFFAAREGIPPPTVPQSCLDLYDGYVTAYTQFINNPNNNVICGPNFQDNVPLYSLDYFVNFLNFCCPPNHVYWTNYINSFYSTSLCPAPQRVPVPCDNYTPPSPSECAERYANYLSAITAYNASSFATTNNSYLSLTLFSSPTSFYELGFCDCVPDYLAYLNNYITNSVPANAAPPVPITIWPGCGNQPPGNCNKTYDDYIAATDNYLNWLSMLFDPTPYPIPILYDFSSFVSSGYCNCAQGYIGFLEGIVNGAVTDITFIQNNFSLGLFCAPITYTCPSQNSLDNYETPPMPSSQNPCVKYKKDLFEANAKAKYEQYIADQTADFIKRYNAYCLGATESLIRTYTSKEFHYTLYYYDQAGNLIKTIPPEGLDVPHYLSITAYNSPNEIKAKSDRKNKTKTLFTNHGMATTYQYNSLNQLMKQKMPDHDALNYIKYKFNYGIDTTANVISSQFPDPNKGYIATNETQYDPYFGNFVRGKIFESTDGSLSWNQVNCITGADLNKIQFVTGATGIDYGFGVGSDGTFVFSVDGGQNWDYYPIHQFTNDNSKLNDLHFFVKGNGNIEGMLVGDKGVIVRVKLDQTTNGQNITSFNINAVTTVPFTNDENVTDITADNTNGVNYYITVFNTVTQKSRVYKSDGSNTPGNWADITSFRLPNLVKVRQIKSTGIYFAVGSDGSLLKSTDNGDNWALVPTNTSYNFTDVYFATANVGVAILESSGIGSLYKTVDGGVNWTVVDQQNSPNSYVSLSQFNNLASNTIDKVTANGTNGLIKRVILDYTNVNAPNIGAVNTSIVSTNVVNDVCVVPYDFVNSTSYKQFAISSGANGDINFCVDYNQNSPVWNALPNAIPPGTSIKKSLLNVIQLSTLPVLDGLLLLSNGTLWSITCPDISTALPMLFVQNNLSQGNYLYNDMVYDWNDLSGTYNRGYLLGTDPSNGSVARFANFILSNVGSTNISPSVYNPSPNNVMNSINFAGPLSLVPNSNNNSIIGVGSLGAIIKGTSTGIANVLNGINVTNNSEKIVPHQINDIYFNTVNSMVSIVGEDGFYAERPVAGNNPFSVKLGGITSDLTAIKCGGSLFGSPFFFATTKQGEVMRFSTNPSSINFVPFINSLTANALNELDVKITNNVPQLYFVGDNGDAFQFSNNLFNQVFVNTSQNLNAVAYPIQNSSPYAVGNNCTAFRFFNLSAVVHKNWYTNQINKLHFTDLNNGYFVGMKGLIRHTQDGGNSWKIAIPPGENFNNNVPFDLYAVYTTALDKAIVGGTHDYIANVSNVNIGPVLTIQTNGNNIWYDIDLYDPNNGFIVGGNINTNNAKAAKLSISNNAALPLPTILVPPNSAKNFRSVYALRNTHAGKFIAVGGTRTLAMYDEGTNTFPTVTALNLTTTFSNNSDIIYDIEMSDNFSGYIVGSRTRFAAIGLDPTSYGVNVTQQITAPTYANLTQNGNHITTVSLIDDVNGFLGGYTGSVIFNAGNPKYAWKFTHEKGKTSTLFWYDRLGRMVLSQNTKQINKTPKAYSYTIYDELGRIKEVGEKAENVPNTQSTNIFDKIFGAYVGNYFNSNVINDTKLNTWISDQTGQRREVTKTYYDNNFFFTITTCGPLPNFTQDNLRKRVASVTYEDVWDTDPCSYNHATHYSYDIHGNVKSLLQDNKNFAVPANNPLIAQRFKRIDYDFDLISGKVNQVSYQAGEPDQFYHQYEYDDDNRITEVKTSRNGLVYETDAKYFYYKHGPLARTEYGHDKVQGMDHAYTLQGWIKGVNSDKLDPNNDIGKDGNTAIANNKNKLFAQDAMGYSLGYYNGDYNAIDATQWTAANRFEANKAGSSLLASTNNLYNGNIGIMNTTIVQPLSLSGPLAQNYMLSQLPAANAYKYDQLNRIADAANFNNLNLATNTWDAAAPTSADSYKNLFEYDDNGNITSQKKYTATGTLMDDIAYYYNKSGSATGNLKQNRLYGIKDNGVSVPLVEDIETNVTNTNPFNYTEEFINTAAANSEYNNYRYDEIGNLVYDGFEKINSISWSVYGKIKEVNNGDPLKKSLKFDYDAMGNRIAKHVYAGSVWESSTYYIRDAQGNVMAIYKHQEICLANCNTQNAVYGLSYKLIERDIYGSSRCGLDEHPVEMISNSYSSQLYERVVGSKQFEMGNHLGNVLSVVSDRKIPIEDASATGFTKYYIPQILSATDYYAFGSPMPGREFSGDAYRYGFGAMEKDDEVKGKGNSYTTLERGYDPRLARWLSIDPVIRSFESPYVSFANNPVYYKDPEGNTPGNGDDKTKKTGTDAGHGDKPKGKKWTDPGAIDTEIEKESDYALLVEEAVNNALKSYGVDNTRTRTEKEVTPDGTKIKWRYDKVNDAGVDVFVSIHLNNGDDNNFLAFYEGGVDNEDESKKLGESILGSVNGLAGFEVSSTQPKDATETAVKSLGVLREFKGEAGVLLEVGGVKNSENRTNIKTNSKEIGEKIAIGMYKYMYGKEPTVQPQTTINGATSKVPSVPVQINPAAADATKVAPILIFPLK